MTERSEIVAYCLAALLFSLVIGLVGYETIHKQQVIADAIKAGADPIATRCALDGPGSSGSSTECVLAAVKGAALRQEGSPK